MSILRKQPTWHQILLLDLILKKKWLQVQKYVVIAEVSKVGSKANISG